MLAVIEAEKTLKEGNFQEIDVICVNKIPAVLVRELEEAPTKTVARLSEVADEPLDYGNDDFFSLNRMIQLQIFYATEFPISVDDFEIKIMKWFKENDWTISDSKPHYLDPDTNQSIKVFYFSKTKYL